MKRIKHILTAMLALVTLGMATGCEGLQLVTPSMGGNSSSSGESSTLVDEDLPLTDDQWDEFVELMEKTEKEKNYTIKTTMSVQVEQKIEGLYDDWISEKGTTTEKRNDRLEEYIESMKQKNSEEGKWETVSTNEKSYRVYPKDYFAGEGEGEYVRYSKDDDGTWQKGSGHYVTANKLGEEYELLMKKELRDAIMYNESTGIYSITDCEITTSAEAYLGVEIESGEAIQKIHKLEYEIKDGYLVHVYQEYEIDIEGTIKFNGESFEVDFHMEIKAEGEFSDYGTTEITLPSQIKDEVEALLEDEE